LGTEKPLNDASVEFAKVSYTASGASVLSDISLALASGSTTALLGRSGSGKTTLLRMVNALVRPTSGVVMVGGRSTAEWPLLELRRGIGYVIQETGLFPHWTVERNTGLALEFATQSKAAIASRVRDMLEAAGLDPGLSQRYPWQLSGGQRQRVGLARALAGDPGVLLMDEPFGALDPMTRSEMQVMLRDLLQKVGKTVLLVTHDLNEALFLAERVVFLEAGRVVADLRSQDVLGSADPYVQTYVAATHREVRR
jgi:osmoprotectant transport system ATP-binding protein